MPQWFFMCLLIRYFYDILAFFNMKFDLTLFSSFYSYCIIISVFNIEFFAYRCVQKYSYKVRFSDLICVVTKG
jgi:hypothetical protein